MASGFRKDVFARSDLPDAAGLSSALRWRSKMDSFIHQQKLVNYRRLIAESERDPARNEVQHAWLLKLLAEEEAMDTAPLHRRH